MEARKMYIAFIIAVFLAILLYLGLGLLKENIQPLSFVEIADNYARYFSVKHDVSAVKNGVFELSPWQNDVFLMQSEGTPQLKREEKVVKQESNDGQRLTVKTETYYWLQDFALAPDELLEIKILWNGEEISVPVKIRIVARASPIDEGSYEFLRNLGEGSHIYTLRIEKTLGGYDSFSPSAVFSKLPEMRIGDLHYLPSILEYTLKNAWREEIMRIKIWKALRDYPVYQKILAGEKLTEDEHRSYYATLNAIRKQAEIEAGAVDLSFSPSVLLNNEIVFALPVRIEKVDGVKVNRVGDYGDY